MEVIESNEAVSAKQPTVDVVTLDTMVQGFLAAYAHVEAEEMRQAGSGASSRQESAGRPDQTLESNDVGVVVGGGQKTRSELLEEFIVSLRSFVAFFWETPAGSSTPAVTTTPKERYYELTISADSLTNLVVDVPNMYDSFGLEAFESDMIISPSLASASCEIRKQIVFALSILAEKAPAATFDDSTLFHSCSQNGLTLVSTLLQALGTAEHCTTASNSLRTLVVASERCSSLLLTAGDGGSTPTPAGGGSKTPRSTIQSSMMMGDSAPLPFHETALGQIQNHLGSGEGCVAIASWLLSFDLLLTKRNRPLAVKFMLFHLREVLQLMVDSLTSVSYIARRQGLKLLTVLLTEKPFAPLRKRLIQSPALLCALLSKLNDDSAHIRYEAYHSLKVFIANPTKALPIRSVFLTNREQLCSYLAVYSTGDQEMDEQLVDERSFLLTMLSQLEPLESAEEVLLVDTE